MDIIDCHTHRPDALPPAIISVEPGAALDPSRLYSVGIHPWHTSADALTPDSLAALDAAVSDPAVVAIGETGLDRLCGADIDTQLRVLEHHVALSEQRSLPLILHVVKAFPEIIALKRRLRPTQPWIIHGFRSKPQLAKQLLDHGLHLSFGEHFNPLSVAITPADRLHFETDTSTLPLSTIASRILASRR